MPSRLAQALVTLTLAAAVPAASAAALAGPPAVDTSAAVAPPVALPAAPSSAASPASPTAGPPAGRPPTAARGVEPPPAVTPVAGAVWPLTPAPDVVRGFDPPLSRYGAGHRGADLLGSPGQAVVAAAPGRVTFAGSLAGRGVVVVSHGATRTTYEPVTATVAVGDTVAAGARIGTLQAVASHCAPATCLHWGLIEGETYLDPLTLVGAGPVRLLPLVGPRRSS